MKKWIGIFLVITLAAGLSSCYQTSVQKPDKLIPKKDFVKMMVDIYLIQGLNVGTDNPASLKNVTQTDLYFSVLKKYDVPDTVFIRSLIYYSSFPKEYEKIHNEIMNVLNESEQQFKPQEKLNTETE
jgi:hypothetical protein